MSNMNTQEVASLLNRSSDQVRRYYRQGDLAATRNGRDLLFDRDEVIKFAESRGIRTQLEREVPQGRNFYQAYTEALRKAPPGSSLTFTKPPALATKV